MRQFLLTYWPIILTAQILALIALVRRRQSARPVVQRVVKKRKGKKRARVDANGWPTEIEL